MLKCFFFFILLNMILIIDGREGLKYPSFQLFINILSFVEDAYSSNL